jgi:DNA replication protein DnaC/MFS family permease
VKAHGWRRAGWWLLAAGLPASIAAFLVLARSGMNPSWIIAAAAVFSLLLSLLNTVDKRRAHQHITAESVAATADRLAVEALNQEAKLRAQLLGTDLSQVTAADVAFERRLVRFRDAGGQTVGTLNTVMDYYQQLHPKRMVILGAPGSGKTVLLLELLVQLLEHRRDLQSGQEKAGVAVPLRFSLAAWNTDTPFEDWLATQITQRFRGVRVEVAQRLVAERRVLPLLDGLDEMGADDTSLTRADAAVKQLNTYLDGRELAPLVVTCRQQHYDRLGARIDHATGVSVQDLSTDLIIDYLRDQVRDDDDAAAWQPVLHNLEQDHNGMLAGQLRTPWRLTLATTIYQQRDPHTHPCELLPKDQQPGRDLGQAEDANDYARRVQGLLLDGFVPAATRLHPSARYHDSERVAGWLRTVAAHLRWQADHGGSGTDIVLHQWWPVAGERRVRYLAATVNLASCLPILCVSLWSVLGAPGQWAGRLREHAAFFPHLPRRVLVDDIWLLVVFIYSVGGAVWVGLRKKVKPPSNVRLARPRTSDERRKLARGLVYGLAVGLAGVLAGGLTVGVAGVLAGGLTVGLAGGLTVGLVYGLDRGLVGAVTPREPLRNELLSVLAFGLALGLALGLAVGLVGGLVGGLAFGLVGGLVGGLVFGPVFGVVWCQVLVRYSVAVWLAAGKRRLPLRFGSFLEWAKAAGVIRVSGIAYQFRHRELQLWLTPTVDAEAASESSAIDL